MSWFNSSYTFVLKNKTQTLRKTSTFLGNVFIHPRGTQVVSCSHWNQSEIMILSRFSLKSRFRKCLCYKHLKALRFSFQSPDMMKLHTTHSLLYLLHLHFNLNKDQERESNKDVHCCLICIDTCSGWINIVTTEKHLIFTALLVQFGLWHLGIFFYFYFCAWISVTFTQISLWDH